MSVEITSHKVNGLNEALCVTATDEQGAGGAYHAYDIGFFDTDGDRETYSLEFQNGPIKEVGVNGISQEALLAIVEHRLQCFQAGEYSSRESSIALTKIQEAMMWLHKRTRDRMARGVEGTNEK